MGRLARPSVAALLVATQAGGHQIRTASAFTVETASGAFLMTARHVVRGRHQATNAPLHPSGRVPDAISIAHNAQGGLGRWKWTSEPLYDEAGRPRWFEHPTIGGDIDAVALPLTSLDGVQLYGYDPAR